MFKEGDVKLESPKQKFGRLYIYQNKQWKTVCSEEWRSNDKGATIAC